VGRPCPLPAARPRPMPLRPMPLRLVRTRRIRRRRPHIVWMRRGRKGRRMCSRLVRRPRRSPGPCPLSLRRISLRRKRDPPRRRLRPPRRRRSRPARPARRNSNRRITRRRNSRAPVAARPASRPAAEPRVSGQKTPVAFLRNGRFLSQYQVSVSAARRVAMTGCGAFLPYKMKFLGAAVAHPADVAIAK
jgi:hypothetical protein